MDKKIDTQCMCCYSSRMDIKRAIKQVFKILTFSLVVLVLSVSYRLFRARNDDSTNIFSKINSAHADVPSGDSSDSSSSSDSSRSSSDSGDS